MRNVSEPAGFLLSGLPGPRGLQRLQAGALAALYLAALLGNVLVLAGVFLVPFSAASELFLLTAMAVDRYAAICHPLHYPVLMDAGSSAGYLLLQAGGRGNRAGLRERRAGRLLLPLHRRLLRARLLGDDQDAIREQAKAYATCLPHLAVVLLFLSTAFAAYLKPMLGSASPPTSSPDLVLSAVYVVLPPALNPVIYSLRNRAMLAGLEKLITGKLLTRENVLVFLHK
ncbi:Olfactory receptor 14A16 [Tupaia chinensis]|uniref:Olfactory receptor 14A16 n=1 Tax=Tupaia chinensis TaxID=246437 RepID=L9KN87_TUPCH|nr:Olfactory receptor 14A16 [Tupaia chinensis]